jgi:hypothetical protein
MDTVSVVTSVHNSAARMGAAVESVLRQSSEEQMAAREARKPLQASLQYDRTNGEALVYLAATRFRGPMVKTLRALRRAIA